MPHAATKMGSMSARSATVLLTGFGAFPGVPINATSILVPRLAEVAKQRFAARIVAEILPVEWTRAPERLAALVTEHRPDVALHFGVSRRARGFAIEARSVNACAAEPDAAGALPRLTCIAIDGPSERRSGLPVDRIVERLTEIGLPAYRSEDAGRYICNALLFHSLGCRTVLDGRRMTGFVHVPASLVGDDGRTDDLAPACPLVWADAIRGGLEILAVTLATLTGKAPSDAR